jgi:anti-sigma regulatory factor (Ser/Thr protein kinase)
LEAGDACATLSWRRGLVVALVDGLGHGPRAAEAARVFLDSVGRHAELALADLFTHAHHDLLRTRGAVAAVARIDHEAGAVEIGGIGNIVVLVMRADGGRAAHAIMVPGILGSAYRTVRPQALPLAVGDILVMHSDGVRSRFDFSEVRNMTAQAASEHVVKAAAKPTDDAACVIVKATTPGAWTARIGAPAPPSDGSVKIAIVREGDAACAAAEARAYGARIGLALRAQWEMSLVASELATNVLKFAGSGTMTLRRVEAPRPALELEMVDRGAGIPDVATALVDGHSEGAMLTVERPRRPGQGLGVGLGSVRRMSDDLDIESTPGRGTRVTALKYLR